MSCKINNGADFYFFVILEERKATKSLPIKHLRKKNETKKMAQINQVVLSFGWGKYDMSQGIILNFIIQQP